jgi:hypothetical protein
MTPDIERLKAVLTELKKPFQPEDHQERKIPGGGTWFFIPWQTIRERIETVVPDYEFEFADPVFVAHLCTVRCKMTICGVSRTAIGNAELDGNGGRGTPVEVAVADAYKNAAEAFGVAAYLDDQSENKREFTVNYLHRRGDGRAFKNAKNNNWLKQRPETKPVEKPAAQTQQTKPKTRLKSSLDTSATADNVTPIEPPDPNCVSAAQIKRFFTIGRAAGYTTEGLKLLCKQNGFESSNQITKLLYEDLCEAAGCEQQAKYWNEQALGAWEASA